jgi:tetratricopeptide (TPR) repeat protein
VNVVRLLEGSRTRERFGLAGFPAVMTRFFLDWAFADLGKFDEGIAYGQEGIRLADALDHPYSLAAMCSVLGYLYIARGELSPALPLLERGVAVSREWSLTFHAAQNMGILGYAYALAGRPSEGIPLLEGALSAIEHMGFGAFQPPFLVFLGEAYVSASRLGDALEVAGRALAFARERGQRGYEAWALRLLGDVTAHRGLPDLADAHYRDALVLAEGLGMRPLVGHCHLGLGHLYLRTGKREQAREHLTTATTMYRELKMRSWLEQTEMAMTALA